MSAFVAIPSDTIASGARLTATDISTRPPERYRLASLAARSVWWPGYDSCAASSTRSTIETGRSAFTSTLLVYSPS